MSDTPKSADDSMKLLDNGWSVGMFKNSMGSYTAYCWKGKKPSTPYGLPEKQVTDDFTPSQALYRLTEKVIGNRIA